MQTIQKKFREKYKNQQLKFVRNFINEVDWSNRLIGIKGARGVGKTTLLLQYIKQNHKLDSSVIYASLDNLYFQNNTLVDFTENFVQTGGKYLYLDEVHRYKNWGIELKNIYDDYPELKIVFTSSSILELRKARADLSRRAVMYEMPGLSLREFLKFEAGFDLPVFSIKDIINNHLDIATDFIGQFRPLQYFQEYLKYGYYPYYLENKKSFYQKLEETVQTVLDVDIPQFQEIQITHIKKLKKLLFVISNSSPFKPNIQKLSEKIEISRNTLKTYLNYLEEGRIINQLESSTKGIAVLQKPEKIYLHDTNLIYVLSPDKLETGNLRETFFFNQVNVANKIVSSKFADFLVNDKYTFEIGGKTKSSKQIAGISDAYIVKDNMEIGTDNKIPLWLFGFLY
ncbi:MAG: AAA family ATPase [Bacteroidetes bacterium 4484_249]|nr:MAG: AAA family ATPase [Bacteroidetes bacterium 4484_249]